MHQSLNSFWRSMLHKSCYVSVTSKERNVQTLNHAWIHIYLEQQATRLCCCCAPKISVQISGAIYTRGFILAQRNQGRGHILKINFQNPFWTRVLLFEHLYLRGLSIVAEPRYSGVSREVREMEIGAESSHFSRTTAQK